MENNNQNNNVGVKKNLSAYYVAGAVIVILLIIAAVWHGGMPGRSAMTASSTAATSSSALATSSAPASAQAASSIPAFISAGTSSIAGASLVDVPLIYMVSTDKKTYRQGEQIDVAVTVVNNTGLLKIFSFKDGCQGDYAVDGFDMIAHTRCLPSPSSFAVAPHNEATVPLVIYPSVFQLPPGSYPIYASIIGYGGATTTVAITN